jgi:hypothetical protein
MRDGRVSLHFFDGQGEFAARYWFHVPRVGHEIMLGAGNRYTPDAAGKAAFTVKRVVWGTEGPNSTIECVNIEIAPVEPSP